MRLSQRIRNCCCLRAVLTFLMAKLPRTSSELRAIDIYNTPRVRVSIFENHNG